MDDQCVFYAPLIEPFSPPIDIQPTKRFVLILHICILYIIDRHTITLWPQKHGVREAEKTHRVPNVLVTKRRTWPVNSWPAAEIGGSLCGTVSDEHGETGQG